MHDAVATLNASSVEAGTTVVANQQQTEDGGGSGCGGRAVVIEWLLRVGVARGAVVTGALGSERHRQHTLGRAVMEAAQLARSAGSGETRVARSLARAERAFIFNSVEARTDGGEGMLLVGQRRRDMLVGQ